MKNLRTSVVCVITAHAAVLVLAACNGSGPAAPDTPSNPAIGDPSPQTPVVATVPSGPSSNEVIQQAVSLMGAMFTFDDELDTDGVNIEAVRLAGELGYSGLIPPLVEITRFVSDRSVVLAVEKSLHALTGQALAGDDFFGWYAWLGNRPDIEPVRGYASWKGRVYSYFDPRFTRFLNDALPARIPLSGVQWGGVEIDGIPPLENPRFMPAAQAEYLTPDEQVFGVTINGESRAYPHRIMNWHEMANDVIGGKPVTLVY